MIFRGGMRNLSEDILASHKDRRNKLQDLKDQADAIKKGTAQFLDETRRLHEGMGKDLKNGLRDNRKNL